MTIADFERVAKDRLIRPAQDYYMSGANAMLTLNSTRDALDRIKLKRAAEVDPSLFVGTETTVLGGLKVQSPIMIASTAFHKMAHPDGEVAMARAAEISKTAFSLSNWANSTNEEVGLAAPSCLKMFQIYMSKSDQVN